MNQPELQPECDRHPVYFDPEAPDPSEQEFSASLENESGTPPVFQLDEMDAAACAEEHPIVQSDSAEYPISDSIHQNVSLDAAPQTLSKYNDEPGSRDADWREHVSAKVSSYKSRSRYKPRYPSLQLEFEEQPVRARQAEPTAAVPQTFSQSVAAEIIAMQPVPMPQPESPRIIMEATARVLEFPRPAPPTYDPDELAEPMFDRPRIVEAPELVLPPPAMGGILIEPPPQPEPERRPGFDMPLASAPLSRRVWAGVMDALVLAIAVAMFIYIFVRVADVAPPWRAVASLSAILLAILCPAYQYAFLVFSDSTPGLRLARLQVQRFDGTPAPRSLRRWRVLASFLSAASLGLGYAWCFLDEDQLTWHDRITRTHLAPLRRS